jgi:hypothetical protein
MSGKTGSVKKTGRTKTASKAPAKAGKTIRPKTAPKPAGPKRASKPAPPPDPMHDGSRKPDDALLRKMLGKSMNLWTGLRAHLAAAHPPVREEWKFYGLKYGWGMKVLRGTRNLFFFSPRDGWFMAGFVFGDKAAEEVRRCGLPEPLIREFKEAKKYPEGWPLRVEVRSGKDLESVQELVAIKIRS